MFRKAKNVLRRDYMGLESYFLHLLPNEVTSVQVNEGHGFTSTTFAGKSPVAASVIIGKIETTLPSKLHCQNKLVVDDAIKVVISVEDGLFQKVTLIGCFAWYDEGLSLCYQIACVIDSCIEIQVYHQLTGRTPLKGEMEFQQTVKGIYQEQHQSFVQTFGHIRKKILPGKDFYNFYRGSKRVQRVL
jgi:hypothetical protein